MIYILFLSFILILLYKAYFITPLIQYKDSIKAENPTNFSVFLVISAKNESERLENVLRSTNSGVFLESGSKVIVVDDYSDSAEFQAMKGICESFENVYFIASKATSGKKHALRFAIEKYPHPYYAFTDADCILGEKWFQSISYAFSKGDFVIGYAPFMVENSFLNGLQRYESMWIACQYFGYAIRKIPYMAVGRNMGASAQSLKKAIPNMKADHLLSGDDDMLVQALQKNTNISLMLHPQSFAKSRAEGTYRKYLNQKTRQITTSLYYKPLHKFLLAGIGASLIAYYLTAFLLLFKYPFIAVGSMLLMGMLNVLFFWVPTQKLQEIDLKWKVLYLEGFYAINLIILALYSLVPKKKKWK